MQNHLNNLTEQASWDSRSLFAPSFRKERRLSSIYSACLDVKLFKQFSILFFCVFLLCSCSIFTEDLTEAKRLGAEKKYAEAIAILDHFKGGNSKKYNAQLRVEYGVDVLRNLDESKSERHQLAKTLFEEAVRLDPKNTKARTFYLTLLKTTHNEDLTE